MADINEKIMICLTLPIRPVKPPVNLLALIIFRVFTLLLIFLSLVTLALSVVMRPWKMEHFEGDYAEYSLWTVCRYSQFRYYDKCFDDYYKENAEDMEPWFYVWRYFLVISLILLTLVFAYLIIEQTRKNNHERKAWGYCGLVCLFAGAMTFTAVVLFIAKFPFDFGETFRSDNMGWTEIIEFDELVGMPYTLCWASILSTLFASYFCYYMKCKEDLYIEEYFG